jgi:hypothetical protein
MATVSQAPSLWETISDIGRSISQSGRQLGNYLTDPKSSFRTPIFPTDGSNYRKPAPSIVPDRPVLSDEFNLANSQPISGNFNGSLASTGVGNLSNGLWNNGVGAQNPLSVGYAPTQVDTVAKAPIGAGNAPTQSSTPSPMLYASNQASNFNGAPTVANATMSNPTQEMTNPMDMSMPVKMPSGYNVSDPTSGLAANAVGSASTPYSFMDNFTDFSSKDAAKNSLGNIATGVNVAGGLFDAYTKYQTQKALADYQNRIAGLYEKQYADTEARRAQAQANYDASVPK